MNAFDRLKLLCDNKGISINKLEEDIGLSKNTLYTWNRKIPTGRNLLKVAEYFNVSIDYLLGRTNIKSYEDYEIQTIAAHHDGDDWTEEELKEIEDFKKFVKMKRHELGLNKGD